MFSVGFGGTCFHRIIESWFRSGGKRDSFMLQPKDHLYIKLKHFDEKKNNAIQDEYL